MSQRMLVGLCAFVTLAQAHGQSSFVNWETPQVHPLDLTPDGTRLLAVNTADNRLEVFDVSRGTPLRVASIPVGLDPVSVRARSNNEAWVVNQISDSISIVDLPSARVVNTIATGDEPADVVFAGSPQRAFVSVSQLNQVRVINPATPLAPPQVIAIAGEDPRALAVDATGTHVYAAIFESGNRSTILARAVVSNPNGPYNGQNPPPNAGTQFVPAIAPGLPPPPPVSLIVRQDAAGRWRDDNNRDWSTFVLWGLHDHDVAIIDTASLGVTYASHLMNTVAALAVTPGGDITAVGTDVTNQIRFESNINGTFARVQIGSFSPSSPATTNLADLNPHLDYSASSVAQSIRDQSVGDPRGIVWLPSGAKAYVSGMGSSNVIATNVAGARLGTINVGQGPTGLAINPAGSRLYVLNRFDGSISTIDTAADAELSRVSFYDPTPAAIKLGRPFLYDTHMTSGLGQASCASCHIDGRTDHLAWDLGNPAGQMQAFDETCVAAGGCVAWHPMKGPMVTQTLQGIIGNEPFHWRGEKTDLSEFSVAYTDLQGDDAAPSAAQMQQLEAFVATLQTPPNPNRNLDGTLPNSLSTSGGNGNAQNGLNIYTTQPIIGGTLTCVSCHALPDGTNTVIDRPLGPEPQNRKMAQLRNMYDKAGFNRATLNGNRGFGFNHDGTEDTLNTLLSGPGFAFPPGPPGAQQRRDVEAFLLALAIDTHPAVGAQATVLNGAAIPAPQQTLINQMLSLAGGNLVGLVVKGRQAGIDRGYAFIGGGTFQSDRTSQTISAAALLAAAAVGGSELTWTVVPKGSETRIGIDRDLDGWFDRDELDAGSDPANPASTPLTLCTGDLDHSGIVNGLDLAQVLGSWSGAAGYPSCPPFQPADLSHDCKINGIDLAILLGAWGPCK